MLMAVEKGQLHAFRGKSLNNIDADGNHKIFILFNIYLNFFIFTVIFSYSVPHVVGAQLC